MDILERLNNRQTDAHSPVGSGVAAALNPAQAGAVMAPFKNLLILAGAGSGKTRVLVHRIAWYFTEHLVPAHCIFAVTFTNKAAQEMRSRLSEFVSHQIYGMWVGTFHGLSHKLLRLHWKEAGLPQNFQVMDGDDQLQLIKRLFKTLNINEDYFEPKQALGFINRKKDEGIRASHLGKAMGSFEETMAQVYTEYEKECEKNGLIDFAELLLRSYETLKSNETLLHHYQQYFLHFFVDEFQDTNGIQYAWLRLLSEKAESVTVVGDDDQSIYGWRGAKVENIRRFEREYKETEIIRLEQNYRSTATILKAANALIANNEKRFGKTLWTAGNEGDPIILHRAFNEEDEALYIVREIRKYIQQGENPKNIGVLYRSNAQSRMLEEALVRAGLPYCIYGGLRFFERAEIKDALAYLRLAANPHDNVAYERVVNAPPRGIGDKTVLKIKELADLDNCSYWTASLKALSHGVISGKSGAGLSSFIKLIETLHQSIEEPLSRLIEIAIQESGLMRFFKDQKGEKSYSRVENLEELLNASFDFSESMEEEMNPLMAFLSYTALEGGERRSKETEDAVQLMTLHAAKGLEFKVVFIAGVEEGLFPHHFSSDNPQSLEEERRLCYVGITRAKQHLHLSYAESRRLFGREELRSVSRFIGEIPHHLIKETQRKVVVHSAYRRPISPEREVLPPIQYSQTAEQSDLGGFCMGQRVVHPKFGAGTIVDHEGVDERSRVHVHFDLHGSKWLALAFAKLTPA